MKSWNNRSIIEASLLNPAFCGILLYHAIAEYNKTANEVKFEYPLIYIILPLLLHSETRESFPHSTATKFINWCISNKHLSGNFSTRTTSLRNTTNEALMFMISRRYIEFKEGRILYCHISRKLSGNSLSCENQSLIKKAKFLGKWLQKAGDSNTIYSLLIRP